MEEQSRFKLILLQLSLGQLPPRFQVPGALLVQGARPAPQRQQRINAADFIPRPRRPHQPPSPPREVKPVVEEEQENYPQSIGSFDDEVNKLSIPAISAGVRQAEEEEPTLRPSPLPFRPERPIPVTRDQIRERPVELPSSRPVIRQEPRPLPPITQSRPKPIRPVVRQELDEDDDDFSNIPTRQQSRPKVRPQQQQFRPAPQRPAPRPQFEEDDGTRKKKPVSQILRKYRTDNPDGTITWGFENDDGTFKEETLGIDCIIKGKYGYIDPEGTRREYEYEAGNKCDPQQEALDEEEEELAARPPPKQPNKGKFQPQYRPQQVAQY
ncbi:uncharacterized protein isoform X2 [Leptinotarsa decemlineata]|uniref:uncharacterized protein isoform X2 n=1 Tax=Leptinotarsa decemlineata TaxID=7539 RepID=UPI003D30784A